MYINKCDIEELQEIVNSNGKCPKGLDSWHCWCCSIPYCEEELYGYSFDNDNGNVDWCNDYPHALERATKLLNDIKIYQREEKLNRILNGNK